MGEGNRDLGSFTVDSGEHKYCAGRMLKLVHRLLASALLLAAVIVSSSQTQKLGDAQKKRVTLITFDVDGTLVQGSSDAASKSVHSRAFVNAVGKVFGGDEAFFEKGHPTAVIPSEKFHGCTDGLIALNIAKYGLDLHPSETYEKLDEVFYEMFGFVASHSDDDVSKGIDALPGVIDNLSAIGKIRAEGQLYCGLVTGNVEGIARKKMRAVGVLATNALSPCSEEQLERTWAGYEDCAFLGGFGSDYCSGDIEDSSRIFKDRGEQILICARRAQSMMSSDEELGRIIHVGDAVADVLAAKHCREHLPRDIIVGCVGVGTGKWTVDQLTEAAGTAQTGYYEPIILEKGINDPSFMEYCFPNRGRL